MHFLKQDSHFKSKEGNILPIISSFDMYKHSQQTANIPTSKYLRYAIHFALLPGEKTKMYKYIHCSVHCTIMTEHYPTHLAKKLLIPTIKISLQLISELMDWIFKILKNLNIGTYKTLKSVCAKSNSCA